MKLRYVWPAVFLILAIWSLVAMKGPLGKYRVLSRTGLTTGGTITKVERSNHATVHYMGVSTYEAREAGISGVELGQRLLVTYLPGDPAVSTLFNPGQALRSDLMVVLLFASTGTSLVSWITHIRQEESRGRLDATSSST